MSGLWSVGSWVGGSRELATVRSGAEFGVATVLESLWVSPFGLLFAAAGLLGGHGS